MGWLGRKDLGENGGMLQYRLHDLAVLHMHDPVGLGRQLVVVGDDHEGRPTGFVQFTHHAKKRLARMRIQISSWFISQHEIWFLQEGSCDRYALLLTAGQLTRLVMQPSSQSDLLQQRDGFRFNIDLMPSLDQGRHTGILKRRELRQEMMKLEDKSDTPIPKFCLFTFRHVKYILPVKVDRPCRRTIERPDYMEQCALSGSRSPDNRNQLPPLNLEIDAFQYREGLPAHRERFVQICDGNHAGAPE
jgi:hypothetical protein